MNEQGYKARTGHREVLIALNPATAAKDVASLEPGGVLILDEALPQAKDPGRDDITVFAVPMVQIAKDFAPDVRLRRLLLLDELNCGACHSTIGRAVASVAAPDLNEVGWRVAPDYLRRFIADPGGAHSGTKMPALLHGLPPDQRI